MNHRRSRLALLPALLLAVVAASRAAAQRPNPLVVAFDPPVVVAGQPVAVIPKNFDWSRVARLDLNLVPEAGAPVALADDLKLGPRRRATLPADAPAAGLWQAEVTGTWLFFETLIAPPAALLVATEGSTAGVLALDTPVEGTLAPGDDGALGAWAFDLTEETDITLQAQPSDGAGSLELTVLDAAGEALRQSAALIPNLTLPAGRYLVAVQADEALTYTLTLGRGLSGDAEGGELQPGVMTLGLLSPADDVDEYTFAAAPGDVVYAAMTATDTTLDPYLEIIDPVGNVVAANDDASGFDAALAYVVPVSGQYTLRLTSNQGGSTGGYALELAHDPEMARLSPPTRLTIGQSAAGEVPRGGAQAWRLVGAAGDTLGVLVEGQEGFDAQLTLYGPDGGQLAFSDDDGGGLNPLIDATLPADGPYTLVISSYTGAAGDYTITAAASAQPFLTPAP